MDKAGVPGSCAYFVAYDAATVSVGVLLAAAASLGGALDGVSGAKITGFQVNIPALPDPSWKAAPIAGIDIEQTLRFDGALLMPRGL